VGSVSRLTIEYNGADFCGWAKQPGLRSVAGVIESAIATVLGEPVALSVAGRTDRGVHAWGQVASYQHEALSPATLNALLPPDVSIRASEPMAESFDARYSARSRTYCYRLLARRERSVFHAGRALWVPNAIDVDALKACAILLAGRHDFTAFTPTETIHTRFERRVISAHWREAGELLDFWIEADSFMRQMIRVLVGTMLEVARGRRSVDEFGDLLSGAPRRAAGNTAPSHGLYLAAVSYG
jgi:tRNA pseudouridine38-40 synthase